MGRRWLASAQGEFERLLDVLGEGVTVTEPNGQLVFANAAALSRMGMSSDEALATTPGQLLARYRITDEDGQPVAGDRLPGRRLLRGEEPVPLLLRLVEEGSGRVSWTLVKATEFVDDGGRRLAVNVLEDVTEAKEQELRERFLADASEALASSLDYEETLRRVAWLAIPQLADWCSVEMLDGRAIRQVAVAHVDPAKIAFARQLRDRFPPRLEDPTGVGAVLRTGRPELYPSISEDLLVAAVTDSEQRTLLRELRLRSVIAVPMRSRAHGVIGAISFVAAETVGSYGEADRAFLESFAARAASAVENARLYRERSDTAKALQHSLLPARLPAIAGWQTATRYRPASSAAQIGGDFFDLFRNDDGFMVVIGDVTGKGAAAAAITGLARHSARTAALLGRKPAQILALLNRLLLERPHLEPVTAVVAQVTGNRDGARVTLACAGHPLPLRHRPGRRAVKLGAPGVVLGFEGSGDWTEQEHSLAPGDTLLFYTDGLTDTIGATDRFGEDRLRAVVAEAPGDPEALLVALDRAVDRFGVGGAPDDLAMLALRLVGASAVVGSRPAGSRQVSSRQASSRQASSRRESVAVEEELIHDPGDLEQAPDRG